MYDDNIFEELFADILNLLVKIHQFSLFEILMDDLDLDENKSVSF